MSFPWARRPWKWMLIYHLIRLHPPCSSGFVPPPPISYSTLLDYATCIDRKKWTCLWCEVVSCWCYNKLPRWCYRSFWKLFFCSWGNGWAKFTIIGNLNFFIFICGFYFVYFFTFSLTTPLFFCVSMFNVLLLMHNNVFNSFCFHACLLNSNQFG